MAKYIQIGKGAAFTREKTNPKQPDFGGTCTIQDKEMQVSLWKSRTKKGDPYLSMQFSDKIEDESDTDGPWNEGKQTSLTQDTRKDHE